MKNKIVAGLIYLAVIITITIMVVMEIKNAKTPEVEDNRANVFDRLIAGEELKFVEVDGVYNSDSFAREAEAWCVRHNVPVDQRPARIRELVFAMTHAKIRIDLPDQPEGEPSS